FQTRGGAADRKRSAGRSLRDHCRRSRVLGRIAGGGSHRDGNSARAAQAVESVASGTGASPSRFSTRACHAREEGLASPCAASNVAARLECAIIQPSALRYGRCTLGLYSSRYLATTG